MPPPRSKVVILPTSANIFAPALLVLFQDWWSRWWWAGRWRAGGRAGSAPSVPTPRRAGTISSVTSSPSISGSSSSSMWPCSAAFLIVFSVQDARISPNLPPPLFLDVHVATVPNWSLCTVLLWPLSKSSKNIRFVFTSCLIAAWFAH
jgi:hypothetical protein